MEHITREEILNLPVTTNRINVEWNHENFFNKYSIVSYRMTNGKKNLSYEQLSNVSSLSVTGIWAKYEEKLPSYTKFFVLTKKGEETNVLFALRKHDDIASSFDTLQLYSDDVQKRIVASLAINSLGKKRIGNVMYNNGSLLVCDDQNFGVSKSRKELVCLKVEVNAYMNISAQTMSFTNPKDDKELLRHSNCVFLQSKEMDGTMWLGRSIKPVVIKGENPITYKLDELYISGKRFKSSHNLVAYWPWKKDRYNHGKLFVIWQIIESVNNDFKGLVNIDFTDYEVLDYEEFRPKKEMLSLLKEYFQGKKIFIEDSFNDASSKKQIKNLTDAILRNNEQIVFPLKASACDMVIRLCEPKETDKPLGLYSQSLDRMNRSTKALQHVIHTGDEETDKISDAKAIRILIELLIKDSNIKCRMPSLLSEKIQGWHFLRWKINKNSIFGASMKVSQNNIMTFKDYGFDMGLGEDYSSFIKQEVEYNCPQKIMGRHDYMALSKGDNTYLILDTDEIPILDAKLIDEAYGKIMSGNDGSYDTIAMFKRKKEGTNHKFLRGYMGFHLWKSEGIDGEEAYSYIAGWNSENINTTNPKIDKVPHARRIFILKKGNPNAVKSEINEIKLMLMEGFGRWDELMTYPYPFKFLQEHLDNQCEMTFNIHWNDITFNKSLI